MRARGRIPGGVQRDPEAAVTVLLQNSEAYVSRPRVRLPAGGTLRVQVVNEDGFARDVVARSLHGRRGDLGPLDWGTFGWEDLTPADGEPSALAAGVSATRTLRPRDDAFAIWIGDPDGGDQAGTVIELERGPRTESVPVGDVVGAHPLHAAVDGEGHIWTTLSGVDAIARISPAADLSASARETYPIPGGAHEATATTPPLAPGDIAVDHRGIVWATLTGGNALARIDPARTRSGTGEGIRVYPLQPCGPRECAAPLPADPRETVPSREPLQMDLAPDGRGGTAVWFTEAAADKIGVLRFAADGTLRDEAHISCGCQAPGGIAMDGGGDIWFTEAISNAIGRLTPDVTHPYGSAGIRLRHHRIPSAVPTIEPELSRTEFLSSVPHSVAIDRHGLVWFTESATGKLGVLDPDEAVPGTTQGFLEITVPENEFGGEAVPADLVVDRRNGVFWTDEYGDQVGIVDASGPRGNWAAAGALRPAARLSLTDSPLVTPEGDLFFVELGANLLTRVAGVSAGLPAPAAPPVIEVRPDEARVTGTGLREAAGVTITVRRAGNVAGRAEDVPVAGGAFHAPVDVRAGDDVTVQPVGDDPHAPLRFSVPAITATADAAGAIAGRALMGDRPLADSVEVAGSEARSARIDPADGAFAAAGGTSIAWAQGTPAAVVRTVVAVERPSRGTSGELPAPTRAPQPGPQPSPQTPSPRTPPPSRTASAAGCRAGVWLGPDRRPALIGLTEAQARACAGAPSRIVRRGAIRTWRYGGTLELRIRAGRVIEVRLLDATWRSADGRIRVGARRAAVLRALPGARADRGGIVRAVLRAAGGGTVDLRAARGRSGRVGAITVTLRGAR